MFSRVEGLAHQQRSSVRSCRLSFFLFCVTLGQTGRPVEALPVCYDCCRLSLASTQQAFCHRQQQQKQKAHQQQGDQQQQWQQLRLGRLFGFLLCLGFRPPLPPRQLFLMIFVLAAASARPPVRLSPLPPRLSASTAAVAAVSEDFCLGSSFGSAACSAFSFAASAFGLRCRRGSCFRRFLFGQQLRLGRLCSASSFDALAFGLRCRRGSCFEDFCFGSSFGSATCSAFFFALAFGLCCRRGSCRRRFLFGQ